MENALVRLIGWRATILHGDPCVVDRWRWLRQHLLPGPLRTLDAGCGSGAFTLYASRVGNESTGIAHVERNTRVAEARGRILGIRNVRFLTLDLRLLDTYSDELGKFDQILCFETIEHIQDDEKLISDLSGLLKPGGRLLLTTPYKSYRPMWGDKLSKSEDGGHVRWGYTHSEIRTLLDKSGVVVQTEEFISGFVSQQLTNLTRILTPVSPKLAWSITLSLRPLRVIDKLVTRLLRYPYLSIAVVGVKQT